MSLGIPQAAGITGILSAAGLTAAEVHSWFSQPRRELRGLTPGVMLGIARVAPTAASVVLELARRDAAELRQPQETGT